jgi:hypothetical protein
VLDETQKPIEGAHVSVTYYVPPRHAESAASSWQKIDGMTDRHGTFRASHKDSSRQLGISARKLGYYTTHGGHEFYVQGQYDDDRMASNRNPLITLVLKKVIRPVPMYANRVDIAHTKKPAFDKPIGFDLTIGDWVVPYGKGTNSHMFFAWQVDEDGNGGWDSRMTITFPNPGDGIQEFELPGQLGSPGSELRSPQQAPAQGYHSVWVKWNSWHPNRPGTNTYDHLRKNYFLRVQTVLDENGKITNSVYGKIYGDFDEVVWMYLNPEPNSRDIEFDPKRNLGRGGIHAGPLY